MKQNEEVEDNAATIDGRRIVSECEQRDNQALKANEAQKSRCWLWRAAGQGTPFSSPRHIRARQVSHRQIGGRALIMIMS